MGIRRTTEYCYLGALALVVFTGACDAPAEDESATELNLVIPPEDLGPETGLCHEYGTICRFGEAVSEHLQTSEASALVDECNQNLAAFCDPDAGPPQGEMLCPHFESICAGVRSGCDESWLCVALTRVCDNGSADHCSNEGPVAVTLNDSNTGPRLSNFTTVGTLVIDEPRVYSGYRADRVIVKASGKGARLVDSYIKGNAPYAVDTTSGFSHGLSEASDFVMEYVYVENTGHGKGILGGGFTLRRSRVVGGEDGLHLTTGHTLVKESIIEEQNHKSGAHADTIQLSSGGQGGSLTVEDSLLQCLYQMSNAPIQVNVISGPVVSRRNWIHGGVYGIHGDPQTHPVVSEDDLFAYGTAQFGVTSVASRTGAKWWSRNVRPRKSGKGGFFTPSGEANGFPGNGTPIP